MATKCLTLSTIPELKECFRVQPHGSICESQCIKSSFLISRSTNSTLTCLIFIVDISPSLSSKYFFNTNSSVLSNHSCITHLA